MTKNFNLQMFAEAVSGKNKTFLFRVLKDAATKAGTNIAFVTEDSLSISKDADSTATKDGNIRTPGDAEIEASVTSILKKGDTVISDLKKAMLNDELLEIWRVDLSEPASGGSNKFKGTYYQGYLTEFEETASAEEYVECSLTFGINGKGADGEITVTKEQQEMAAYVFKDSTVGGA